MRVSLTIRLLNYLSHRSRLVIWSVAIGVLLLLGWLDYATGNRISITFFYLFPISLVAWALGKERGWIAAALSALVFEGVQYLGGGDTVLAISFWNLAVRLGVFLVVSNLIADLRYLLIHQTELSRTDPLTSIANRRAFEEAAHAALANIQREGRPLTFAFMDIDDFKGVNDSLGHAAGDEVLMAVAACLRSQLWGTDLPARLGGDEFGILMPHTDARAAEKVMPRLGASLRHEMAQHNWPVTFTVGVVTCAAPPPDLHALMRLADGLMYAGKRGGKDRIEYLVYPGPAASSLLPAHNEAALPTHGVES